MFYRKLREHNNPITTRVFSKFLLLVLISFNVIYFSILTCISIKSEYAKYQELIISHEKEIEKWLYSQDIMLNELFLLIMVNNHSIDTIDEIVERMGFEELFAINSDTELIRSRRKYPGEIHYNFKERPWYLDANKISKPFVGYLSKKPLITVESTFNNKVQFVGFYDLEKLFENKKVTFSIWNSSGDLLYSNNYKLWPVFSQSEIKTENYQLTLKYYFSFHGEQVVNKFFHSIYLYLLIFSTIILIYCIYFKIWLLSLKDNLTNVYNRNMLEQCKLISSKHPVNYIFIDLDNFKKVNDIYGHDYGDQILVKFSKILTTIYYDSNVLRLGGDEFLILSNHKISSDSIRQDLFKTKFNKYFNHLSNLNFGYTSSNGSIYGDWQECFKCIDEELYKNKKKSKN